MKNEFVPYDLALAIWKLGGRIGRFGYYHKDGEEILLLNTNEYFMEGVKFMCDAPLYQQAFRWFREEYKLSHIWIMDELLCSGEYSYEEAELECLRQLIEIVKLNQNKDENNNTQR